MDKFRSDKLSATSSGTKGKDKLRSVVKTNEMKQLQDLHQRRRRQLQHYPEFKLFQQLQQQLREKQQELTLLTRQQEGLVDNDDDDEELKDEEMERAEDGEGGSIHDEVEEDEDVEGGGEGAEDEEDEEQQQQQSVSQKIREILVKNPSCFELPENILDFNEEQLTSLIDLCVPVTSADEEDDDDIDKDNDDCEDDRDAVEEGRGGEGGADKRTEDPVPVLLFGNEALSQKEQPQTSTSSDTANASEPSTSPAQAHSDKRSKDSFEEQQIPEYMKLMHLVMYSRRDRKCQYCCTRTKERKRCSFFCSGCPDKPHLHPKKCFVEYHKGVFHNSNDDGV